MILGTVQLPRVPLDGHTPLDGLTHTHTLTLARLLVHDPVRVWLDTLPKVLSNHLPLSCFLSFHCCMNQMYSDSLHPIEQELGQELGQGLGQGLCQGQGLVHLEVEMVRRTIF